MVYYWEISCVHYYHCVSNRDHLTKKVSSWYTPSHWHFVVEGSNMESSYTCIFHSWIFQRGWGGGGYEICGLTPTVPLVMPLGGVFVVMFKWREHAVKKDHAIWEQISVTLWARELIEIGEERQVWNLCQVKTGEGFVIYYRRETNYYPRKHFDYQHKGLHNQIIEVPRKYFHDQIYQCNVPLLASDVIWQVPSHLNSW